MESELSLLCHLISGEILKPLPADKILNFERDVERFESVRKRSVNGPFLNMYEVAADRES